MAKGKESTGGGKGGTKIMRCTCKYPYQDERYGPGMRVHNPNSQTPPKYKCTVCGSVK